MPVDKTINISAVSYANTYPFLYGLLHKMSADVINISLDVPSECAQKLCEGKVDIGLIPVAKINDVPNATIISEYCIGAVGAVKTVLLMSQVPLEEIHEVFLDSESRTSVNLVKVLAKHYWKKNWQWQQAPKTFPIANMHQSIVLIGDKTSQHRKDYPYIYDLAEIWFEFTRKPFVFAVWVANTKLPDKFIKSFNSALSFGLYNIDSALDVYAQDSQREELKDYLTNYISYDLDLKKKEGMDLFLKYLKTL